MKNQETTIGGLAPPDASFLRTLALLRKIQLSGAVALRIRQDLQKQSAIFLALRSKDTPPEILQSIHELRTLLKVDPNAEEIRLVYGGSAANSNEVAVLTRSVMLQLATLASQVDVPPEDLRQGRTAAGWESLTNSNEGTRLIRIRCSTDKPADAFVSIRYRNHWFWIDDRDLKSKRVLAFMMMMFTLTDTSEKENPPMITIPAQ